MIKSSIRLYGNYIKGDIHNTSTRMRNKEEKEEDVIY